MTSSAPPGQQAVNQALQTTHADRGYFDYKLAKKGRSIVLYAPVLRIDTGSHISRSKTIGIIATRYEGEVLKGARSGWQSYVDKDDMYLDIGKWNSVALYHVAPLLNFQFPGSGRDNHSLPPEEIYRGREHAEILRQAYPDAPESWLFENLRKLRKQEIGRKRHAVIIIDSQPCRPCLQFIYKLAQYTDLEFSVRGGHGVGPTIVRVEGQRRYDTFDDVFPDSESESESGSGSGNGHDSGSRGGSKAALNKDDEIAGEGDFEDLATFGEVPDTDTASISSDATMREEEESPPVLRPPQPFPHNSISRMPENHLQLIAEYKKGTPVYQFPGYDNTRSQDTTRRDPEDEQQEWSSLGEDYVCLHPDRERHTYRFDGWRHQPTNKPQSTSILKSRFPFLSTRFTI
ncbi:hypothetical protein F5X99DRAFT_432716 [Biscogniauxia marginata]|nr:hypothetical protein F5X99DRAFT_432716 [Biscogniauxia marginata]